MPRCLPLRAVLPGLALLALLTLSAVPAAACPFCVGEGKTLTSEIPQANMVLVGSLKDADARTDTTKLVVDEAGVIKDDANRLPPNRVLTIKKYLPEGVDPKYKFLVFCYVYKNEVEPYRGVAVRADVDVAGYLKTALAMKDDKESKRLAFFFKYLDCPELELQNDAYLEFVKADPKDTREMARGLSQEQLDKVAAWLKDDKTPAFRFGLYASILGYTGQVKYAEQLHDMLGKPENQEGSTVNGVLAGYVMLRPQEGWAFLRGVLADPHNKFLYRYAALQSARFFYDNPPAQDINKDKVVEATSLLLKQGDMADMAIEDYRKWRRLEMTDAVLALRDNNYHDQPIVRRAVLRYALAGQDADMKCRKFVDEERKRDPKGVGDVEDLLRLETTPPPTPVK